MFCVAAVFLLLGGCGKEETAAPTKEKETEKLNAEEKKQEKNIEREKPLEEEKKDASKTTEYEKQEMLMKFVNEDIARISYYEEKANAALSTVSGANYTGDEKLYDVLINEVLPAYKKAVAGAVALEPEMEELKPITDLVVEATGTYYEALLLEKEALEKQDILLIEEANAKAAEYEQMISEYHSQMKELSEKYNVIYEAEGMDII